MVLEPEEETCGRPPQFFLDGRRAYTDEEVGQAWKERREAEEAARKARHKKHMDLLHPNGLGLLKNAAGEIIRPAGFKDW